jgi:hypothetical protein
MSTKNKKKKKTVKQKKLLVERVGLDKTALRGMHAEHCRS